MHESSTIAVIRKGIAPAPAESPAKTIAPALKNAPARIIVRVFKCSTFCITLL
jgi:hypothetical protein